MLSYKYRVLMPSGEMDEFRCAAIFGPAEVRDRMHNCEVFMYVARGRRCMGRDGFINGPCWVWLSEYGARQLDAPPTSVNAHWQRLRLISTGWGRTEGPGSDA